MKKPKQNEFKIVNIPSHSNLVKQKKYQKFAQPNTQTHSANKEKIAKTKQNKKQPKKTTNKYIKKDFHKNRPATN